MIKLSICIATYNRSKFIGETLKSILAQWQAGIELLVVDGASLDDTSDVVSEFASRVPEVRYFREQQNSGVDGDYDKAVMYAGGEYCWLMTDDDLLMPSAISRVLSALDGHRELVVVNSEVRTADMSSVLRRRLLPITEDKQYRVDDRDAFLGETAGALSFIGSVVIKRDFWMARERAKYYGSLFIHVGTIFQGVLPANALVIAEPIVSIRYGNAMWTPRGFEVWMFKWPQLIWSFGGFSDRAKSAVCAHEPWKQFRKLWLYRGMGGYSRIGYENFFKGDRLLANRVVPFLTAVSPSWLANSLSSFYCLVFARDARMNIYDLAHSSHSTWVSRAVARIVGV